MHGVELLLDSQDTNVLTTAAYGMHARRRQPSSARSTCQAGAPLRPLSVTAAAAAGPPSPWLAALLGSQPNGKRTTLSTTTPHSVARVSEYSALTGNSQYVRTNASRALVGSRPCGGRRGAWQVRGRADPTPRHWDRHEGVLWHPASLATTGGAATDAEQRKKQRRAAARAAARTIKEGGVPHLEVGPCVPARAPLEVQASLLGPHGALGGVVALADLHVVPAARARGAGRRYA